jgi:hypothetical protein
MKGGDMDGYMDKQNDKLPKFLKRRAAACYESAQVEQDNGNGKAVNAWLLAAVAYGDAYLAFVEEGNSQEVKDLIEQGSQHSKNAARMYQ